MLLFNPFYGTYSEPVPTTPFFFYLFLGVVGLAGGVALLLGANVFKRRRGRMVLLLIAAGSTVALGAVFVQLNNIDNANLGDVRISITSATCGGASTVVCSIQMVNSGTASAQVGASGNTISILGHTTPGTCTPVLLDRGSRPTTTSCSFPVAEGPPGSAFTLYITLSNGGSVPGTGIFS